MPAFLKLHRADIAQGRVNSAVVVERHPVNHLVHRLPAGLEFPAIQAPHFQATPEAFRGCVVPAVALAAHGAFHLVAGQSSLELMPAVLTAPVRMEDDTCVWRPAEPGHA